MPKISLEDMKAKPRRLNATELARLHAMSDDEVDRHAREDVDGPEMSDAQLARAVFSRQVRHAGEATGLSQVQFAQRYRINVSRLRDLEQGRHRADTAMLAYLTVIAREPEAVERALRTIEKV